MPELATYLGLIVIDRTSTILFFGEAAVLLRPRIIGVTILSADLNGPVSDALLRLRSAVLKKSESKGRWGVVDLRTQTTLAND
ncbi:MAG: hypothetical protein BGP11_13020 [Rhodobacterales bacterium 65-51]|uniref:hypothetical protein n=1 Tax=uncultured Gemmobacter sp. TaxID=1095917 RepID=UPI000962F749|nr:hypothetical protein [uncultured Gemmobacter sp.]OJY25811.1 MAG: hypothetical protein BGP11_13020 [Rhodobacterales bacterium 65-51]